MSYATMLTEAQQALSDILAGRSEEVRSLNYQQRMLRIQDLQKNIDWLEGKVAVEAGHQVIRPIRGVEV